MVDAPSGPGGYRNDVWSSENGVHWTERTSAAAWTAMTTDAGFGRRSDIQSAVSGRDVFVMGGISMDGYLADAWRSGDGGVTWAQLNSVPWQPRAWASIVVDQGTI